MGRAARQATVHRIANSRRRLKQLSTRALVLSEWKTKMLLHVLLCPRQPPKTQNYPAPNIQPDSAKAEKACPRLTAPDKARCPWDVYTEDGFGRSRK